MVRPSASGPSSSTNSNQLSSKSAPPSASAGLRNRRANASANRANNTNTGRGVGGSSAGVLRFYTDDAPGLKVGPTTVLVCCLMFVGFVVLLHVWGKFRS